MNQPTPQMRDIAERLIYGETAAIIVSGTPILVAAPVCEKLRPHLANLMGRNGFHALLSRALSQAAQKAPSLRAVQVNAEGAFERSNKSAAPMSPAKNVEASVAQVAQLLELLVAFIGESLTLRLLREIWPTLQLNEWDFDMRDSDEKPN
jgi:hypothetical protein